jgi:hypothetical protein
MFRRKLREAGGGGRSGVIFLILGSCHELILHFFFNTLVKTVRWHRSTVGLSLVEYRCEYSYTSRSTTCTSIALSIPPMASDLDAMKNAVGDSARFGH